MIDESLAENRHDALAKMPHRSLELCGILPFERQGTDRYNLILGGRGVELIAYIRETYEPASIANLGGAAVGLAYGIVAERTGFCSRGAIADMMEPSRGEKPHRLAQFLAAMLTLLVATQAMALSGIIDITQSNYLQAPLTIVSMAVGGVVFGIGLILANGCPGRHLVLMPTGNIRSLVTLLVTGFAAYATVRGILAYPRLGLEQAMPADILPRQLHEAIDQPADITAMGVAGVMALILLVLIIRGAYRMLLSGILVGLIVAFAWWVTGFLAVDEFEPSRPTGLTFAMPFGETLQYLMIFTGDTLRFNIALVAGVVGGAFLSALVGRRIVLRGFKSELAILRYVVGAIMMGFGAVLGIGCAIGQSLTGFSTLATSSLIVTFGILVGAGIMIAIERLTGHGQSSQDVEPVQGPGGADQSVAAIA